MIEKHQKLLSELEFKLQQLIYYCDSLKEENRELKEDFYRQKSEFSLLDAKYKELDQKYNNLKFAQSLLKDQDSESIDKAKERLFQLVRDVDKCISLLKV